MEKIIDVIEKNGRGVYRVEEGDTLESLALKYSTTKEILIRDNNLDGEVINGDVLYIRTFKKVYTVGVLDTPYIVAKKLNVTIEKLYDLNGVDYLYPYQRIIYEDT